MLKRLFWDSQQRRITMVWRLLLQAVLFFVLLSVCTAGIAMLLAGLGLLQEDLSPTRVMAELDSLSQLFTPELLFAFRVGMLLATWLSLWLAGRFFDRRRFVDFGLRLNRNWWLDFSFGLFLGALCIALIFLVEWAAGWLTVTGAFVASAAYTQPLWQGVAFSLLYFIAVGIQEELFSRGYQLKNLAEGLRGILGAGGAIVVATLLSSALFGYLHIGNPNATLVSTFNIFLAGIFLAMGFILTGELAIPIGLHITWNFFQGVVFGFPVSGMAGPIRLIDIEQRGDPLITGGAFGPEGGLVGVGAMVFGCILTVIWVGRRHGRARLHHALTQPDLLRRRR